MKHYAPKTDKSNTTTNFSNVKESEQAMFALLQREGYQPLAGERGRMQNGIYVLQLVKDGKQVTALVFANGYVRKSLSLKKDIYVLES